MSRAACKTELYQRRCSTGLCVQCGVDAGGKSRCTSCAEKDKTARQRRKASRKAAGSCSECGRSAKAGRALCQICIDKRSAVSSARYEANKAAGLCPYCGSETNGAFMCKKCRATHQKGALGWYHRRAESNLCVVCSKPKDVEGLRCSTCRDRARLTSKQYDARIRDEVLEAYGGARCVCCGETDRDILQIDHINGGGRAHLKEIGEPLHRWLHRQGFPPGYQVLCANCNTKKYRKESRQAVGF